MFDITASIILFNTPEELVLKAINSFLNTKLNVKLYLIDNSPTNKLQCLSEKDPRIEYYFNNANLGYGAAHNIAIRKSIQIKIKYHVVLNPDIYFDIGVIEGLMTYMDNNNEVGLVMPKVLYPDGSLQYLCKQEQTPFNLIRRRFLPSWIKQFFRKKNDLYEFKDRNYNTIMEVPNLSGCFMFMRTKALIEKGMFDERFFMYCEDADLVKRIGQIYKTVYYPHVQIIHSFNKESYRNIKLLRIHVQSAVKYFNKWGWV